MPNAATLPAYLACDFDSTFTQVEGLGELADLAHAPATCGECHYEEWLPASTAERAA